MFWGRSILEVKQAVLHYQRLPGIVVLLLLSFYDVCVHSFIYDFSDPLTL